MKLSIWKQLNGVEKITLLAPSAGSDSKRVLAEVIGKDGHLIKVLGPEGVTKAAEVGKLDHIYPHPEGEPNLWFLSAKAGREKVVATL